MATKADFTEDEWKTMQKGVTGAGRLVSTSDRDLSDSFGEASALAKYLAGQHQGAESELIRELSSIRGTGFGFTASPQKVETETLAALRAAVTTLAAKAEDEVDSYRQLVLGVATFVADAKSGVTPTETTAINKIEDALGA
jgi:hypothetical protein